MSNQDLDWLADHQPQHIESDRGARERALAALVRHTSSTTRGRGLGARRRAGIFRSRIYGLAALSGAAAIAAALVLSLSAGGNGAGTVSVGQQSHATQGAQAGVHHHTVSSPLVQLAGDVGASGTPAGDATLVARTTSGGGKSVTVYDLYADNGQYYFSQMEGGLSGEVSAHHNLAGGLFAREIAAAKLAASGNVQLGGEDMAIAPDPSKHVPQTTQTHTISRGDATKPGAYQGEIVGTLYDNWAWENSEDALIAGAGLPAVRAGVLKIIATLPDITVTHGASDGQPTLILTAGTAEVGAGDMEQITINADTGVPIKFVSGASVTAPAATVDYKVSRVTLANLPSGSGS